jgi:glycosyltransferase involved in cell wall biosynthesis
VFPSEFEGFGLPILEAYKNDCPALLNNIPVFREVAGDSGVYFDITDGKSLNEKLEGLFEMKEDDRNALIAKQKERLPLFTAEKMAEGYINVYKSVLK